MREAYSKCVCVRELDKWTSPISLGGGKQLLAVLFSTARM